MTLKPDPYADDPFFKRGPSRTWTACIGRQGAEQNYVFGYIQAAEELAAAILARKLVAQRDTLILPILYNIRHAIELALKFAARRLFDAGMAAGPMRRNHDIGALWQLLDTAKVGDRTLGSTVRDLKPFINSVAAIDDDGQELRYHRNNLDDPSLAKYSIANLEVIKESLAILTPLVRTLLFRTIDYLDERSTGTYTARCSRLDLYAIAEMLPPIAKWKEPIFTEAKAKICTEFGLSGRAFSDALNAIKNHRELKAVLGEETDFQFLSDELVVACIGEWRKMHPVEEPASEFGIVDARNISLDRILAHSAVETLVVGTLKGLLSADQYAELAAMFFLSRDGHRSEYFDELVADNKKDYQRHKDPGIEIGYLFEKTNLLSELTNGAYMLGRLKLVGRLEEL